MRRTITRITTRITIRLTKNNDENNDRDHNKHDKDQNNDKDNEDTNYNKNNEYRNNDKDNEDKTTLLHSKISTIADYRNLIVACLVISNIDLRMQNIDFSAKY